MSCSSQSRSGNVTPLYSKVAYAAFFITAFLLLKDMNRQKIAHHTQHMVDRLLTPSNQFLQSETPDAWIDEARKPENLTA
ncbi:hypothetical protein C9I89_01170 [Photobacterium lipolyticum]|uniref:Uncharacterized protein n=1 Tax=Photobacterium lipolyticum TaxID=266810 RepID=A0A2T3N4E5_9GAMM|nr:hypothetical protein C9I89_01170 [Photobacterium lipolyticum]